MRIAKSEAEISAAGIWKLHSALGLFSEHIGHRLAHRKPRFAHLDVKRPSRPLAAERKSLVRYADYTAM